MNDADFLDHMEKLLDEESPITDAEINRLWKFIGWYTPAINPLFGDADLIAFKRRCVCRVAEWNAACIARDRLVTKMKKRMNQ